MSNKFRIFAYGIRTEKITNFNILNLWNYLIV